MRKLTSLSLEADDIARLQAIAEQLGYLATQGPTTGSGSVSALMRAIADGELKVVTAECLADLEATYHYHEGGDIQALGGW